MTIEDRVIEFANICDSETRMANANLNNAYSQVSSYRLFPNPNSGSMTLEYVLDLKDKAKISIYDITGKEVASYILNSAENKIKFNQSSLDNGVYFYEIKVNDRIVQSDKLIIIK